MGKGIRSFERKQKRAMRRENHIARDLADRKYHQRVINKKSVKPSVEEWDDE